MRIYRFSVGGASTREDDDPPRRSVHTGQQKCERSRSCSSPSMGLASSSKALQGHHDASRATYRRKDVVVQRPLSPLHLQSSHDHPPVYIQSRLPSSARRIITARKKSRMDGAPWQRSAGPRIILRRGSCPRYNHGRVQFGGFGAIIKEGLTVKPGCRQVFARAGMEWTSLHHAAVRAFSSSYWLYVVRMLLLQCTCSHSSPMLVHVWCSFTRLPILVTVYYSSIVALL